MGPVLTGLAGEGGFHASVVHTTHKAVLAVACALAVITLHSRRYALVVQAHTLTCAIAVKAAQGTNGVVLRDHQEDAQRVPTAPIVGLSRSRGVREDFAGGVEELASCLGLVGGAGRRRQ
jgi:hypothetical protein